MQAIRTQPTTKPHLRLPSHGVARMLASLFAIGLLSGCASTLINSPKNLPLGAVSSNAAVLRAAPEVGGESMVALSFSCGRLHVSHLSDIMILVT